MKINFLSLILIVFLVLSAIAQKNPLVFHHITSEHGLSQNHGMCIFQDYKGFMWFGTNDGLNKSNGEKITIYKSDPEDSTSISNSGIRSIYEDKDKNLWIGTQRGLNLYNRAADNFVKFYLDETKIEYLIYAMCEDKMGNFWIGTNTGLYLANKKKKTFKQYLKDPTTCLFCDSFGNLWIGTRTNGMYLFNRKQQNFKNYPQVRISSIFEDQYGNLWVSTWGEGLILFDRIKEVFTTKYKNKGDDPASLSKDIIYTSYKDSKNQIWIGTENGGLNLFDPLKGMFERYVYDVRNKNSLGNNSVSAIFEDAIGTLWVGVHRGGINYCNPGLEKFQLYQQEPCGIGLSHNNIKAFCEDVSGKIWIATDGGGLNVFDPRTNTFKYFRHDPKKPNSIATDVVLSLFEDRQGTMWVGTYLEGLDKYDKKSNKFIHYKHNPDNKNSLSHNNVWNIFEDSKANLWVGTRDGGLNLMDRKSGRFTRFTHDDNNSKSLAHPLVNSIYEDRQKNLWIGTDGGLNLFVPQDSSFIRYSDDRKFGGLSGIYIYTIFEDRAGNLWIGTSNGLNLFDKRTATSKIFNKKNGLPSDVIQSIIEDDHGNLWISTLKGICKLNYKLNTVRNYSVPDGLQDNEFIQNAGLKTRDGKMVFGGINGFNFFHPDSVRDNTHKPPVYITGFQIFNRPVETGKDSPLKEQISEAKEITLSNKQSIFSFEFASLNFINHERNQYAYRMEGFDKEWNYIGTHNSATYTNLNPGKYVFKVKGSTNDGVWNETGASLSIIITPPFWKTLWFKILLCLIVSSAAYTFYKIRVKTITRQKLVLERQVQIRTAQLNESNMELTKQKKELASQAQELKEVNDEIKEQDLLLQNLFTEMKDSIRAAQEIQSSILPSKTLIKQYLSEFFIIYRPKDVVSGDFYWFDKIGNKIIMAIGDCTGHGVSGAFMTINGYHLLRNAIFKFKELIPSDILDALNMEIVEQQRHNLSNSSGMDISLCVLDPENGKLQYAGAKNPLYIIRQKELIQIKADPISIGQDIISNEIRKFTTKDVELLPGDCLYMFTDGFADQLGGPDENQKFMYSRFRELLIQISHEPMEKQYNLLETSLMDWMRKTSQLDDILVMGFEHAGNADVA